MKRMGVNRRPKSGLKSGSIKGSAETRNDLPLDDFFTDHNQQPISGKLIGTRQKAKLDLVDWTKSNGYYTFHQALNSKSGPIANICGKEYKVLSSYDYLGLIGHPKIDKAAIDAINKFGTSSGGVRLLTGTNVLHLELELKLAQFKGTDAALTFSSGYNANLAVLSSLLDTKDLALVDSRIHQSTIDACKLAGVPHRRFEHNNPRSLESLLKLQTSAKKVLIIVEGVYSMDGDICPLKEFVELKKKYNAYLMVDEAHSLGVLGEIGHGVDSHYDIPPSEIDIFTGSLSKAVPASGGFVASSKEIIILLQHGSPPYIFSAALAPPATAAALATLKIFESEPQRIKKLWSNTRFFSKELKKLGYDIGFSSTPIIPIILGANEATLSFARKLFDRQILATPIVFPAVPKSQSRLRLCVNATHEISYLEEVLEIFQKLK